MTTARVDALVARVRAACGYRRPVRVPASMQEVLDLAEILRDSLRRDEQRAGVLVLHQGPFFHGTESRCLCGHPVTSGKEWAAHVDQVLEDGAGLRCKCGQSVQMAGMCGDCYSRAVNPKRDA